MDANALRKSFNPKNKIRTYDQTNAKVMGTNLQYVAFSPIVNSQSKSMYSFGRSSRFPQDNPMRKNKADYVRPQTCFGKDRKKGTSFGCGGRANQWINRDAPFQPSSFTYELPTTKTHISKTFGSEIPSKNKKKEFAHNKVHNTNPSPGQYDIEQRPKSFNRKNGFMGPKPKTFFLGRPDRGSIYEDPTADYPAPTAYQQKPMLNVTAQTSERLLQHAWLSAAGARAKKKAAKGKKAGGDEMQDADDAEEDGSQTESPVKENVRRSQPVKNTLILSKFKSPQGVILDSQHRRFQIDDDLKYRSKLPGPDQYLHSLARNKDGTLKKLDETDSEDSETPSEAAAKKLAKATAPVLLGDEQNFKNYGQAIIGQAKRRSWIMKKERIYGPGPGQYRQQSDFGLYSNQDETGQVQQQFFDKKVRVFASRSKNKGQQQKRPITAIEIETLKNLGLDECIQTPEQLALLQQKV